MLNETFGVKIQSFWSFKIESKMLSDFYKLNKNHRTHTRGSSGSLNTHDTQDFLRAQIMKSLLIFSSFKTWPCSSDAADFLRPQIFLFLDAKPSDHFIFCSARKKSNLWPHTLFEMFIFCPKIQLWFPEKIVDFFGGEKLAKIWAF